MTEPHELDRAILKLCGAVCRMMDARHRFVPGGPSRAAVHAEVRSWARALRILRAVRAGARVTGRYRSWTHQCRKCGAVQMGTDVPAAVEYARNLATREERRG